MADIVFQKGDQPANIFSSSVEISNNSSSKKSIFFLIIAIIFSLFLVAETVYYLIIIPMTSKASVQFTGNTEISSVNLRLIAGITGNETWKGISTFELARKLVACPLIESVNVEKRFPDKVLVNIVERKAVAISFVNVGGVTIPLKIDRNGIIFDKGIGASKSLPVVSGLAFDDVKMGMRVNKSLVSLFMQLDLLQLKFESLMNEISEIKVVQKKFGGYELLVYPVKAPIHIRTQDVLTVDVLKYIMLVVDVIQGAGVGSSIHEVDIRSGNAVYVKQGVGNE